VARGPGDIHGWYAVGWVGGLGAALLLGAAIVFVRARWLPAVEAKHASYRSEGVSEDDRASTLRGAGVFCIVLSVLVQLLYAGMYIELVRWLRGTGDPPHVDATGFFWVFIIIGSAGLGAVWSSLASPGPPARS
jgi:hypothetical protein